jgi:hypothetical protein
LRPRGQCLDLVKIDVERAQLAALERIAGVIADKPEFMIIAEFGPSHFNETYLSPEGLRQRSVRPGGWSICTGILE